MRKTDKLGAALANQLDPIAFTPAMQTRVLSAVRPRRLSTKRVVALTAALMLMLMSVTALALSFVHGSVLDYLFGSSNESPTQDVIDSVQPIALTDDADGVTVTAHDALFDGETLSVGLSIDTASPLFIIVDSLSIAGVPFDVQGSNMTDMWTSNPFAESVDPFTYGFTAAFAEGYVHPSVSDAAEAFRRASKSIQENGYADVVLNLTLLAPEQKLAKIDRYADDNASVWQQIDDCIAQGNTPIDADEPYGVLVPRAFFGDEVAANDPLYIPLSDAGALIEYAHMQQVKSVSFKFQVQL